ncbi:CU044_5270 family protein [Streptomyces sp. Qhu-G9]|uniref:CU044_5270 family protein n=1 Tax=Streptomyces sp. Qhu-G9 TaxID=3452799 RepID=UPI0022ABF4CB|nr:CU044_5270 family protein [Streptomyces aurantiacus]WAU83522.1 CU044_5270 family protein [Streptomyces aurantiacus]
MADELELLRGANPVPSDDPCFGEGPLGHEAERRLTHLMRPADGLAPAGTGLDRWLRRPRPRRTRLVWALASTAVVAVTAVALLFAGPSSGPAVAAPRPLVPVAGSTPVSLDRLAERAGQTAQDGSSGLRKGTHVQSWSMGMSEDEPPVTLPVERIVRWHADESHTELVVATDPRRPGRSVLSDEGGAPRLVDDGHVISEQTYPPSWSDAPPESPPPHDTTRLRAYLQEAQHSDTPLTTSELLQAVGVLLDHWSLGPREDAALARLLADAGGLRPAGRVTDRLDRSGQAYVYDGPGARRMLIMDPATGAVLGLESTATVDEPEWGLEAGDVMDYSAWMR